MILFRRVGELLRGEGIFAPGAAAPGRLKWLFVFLVTGGFIYGMVMGSFAALTDGRYLHMVFAGIKVPLLLLATFALCLPSFWVMHLVAGVGGDALEALRVVVATQSVVTVILASLAPVTALFYLSVSDYDAAKLFNGAMFMVGLFGAVPILRRGYRRLIERNPRHRLLLVFWITAYAFVGIQMAWVLRPFIGNPHMGVSFFRDHAWGNAYMEVIDSFSDIFERMR